MAPKQLETIQSNVRHWSCWMIAIGFALVIMFITFVVIETDIESGIAVGLTFKFFGEIFGIIGGVIGIYLSRSKNDKDMKCLWKGFITLCVFTTVSSFIGFLANLLALHAYGGYLRPYYWKNTYDDYDSDEISDELSLVQVLTIETFLFFVQFIVSIVAATSFGCVKCCRCSCCCIYCQPMPFQQSYRDQSKKAMSKKTFPIVVQPAVWVFSVLCLKYQAALYMLQWRRHPYLSFLNERKRCYWNTPRKNIHDASKRYPKSRI